MGGSLAGLRAAEGLRRHGEDGPITIVGAEKQMPYDRPPLSKQILTGKFGEEATALRIEDGFEAEWLLGTRATGLDLDRRMVITGAGEIPFERLVIATGAHPRQLPLAPPGEGVHYLRTLEDALTLRDDVLRAEHLVIIGAGFIGLEVAASATELGKRVTILEELPVPLERAVGAEMGAALAEWHRDHGVDVRLGMGVDVIEGHGRPEGVRMASGEVVPADTVLVAIGVIPSIGWLQGSGIDLDNGVLCDERLRVQVRGKPRPDVVAAGDVTRWAHPAYRRPVRIEHWTNAAEQGESAALTLLQGDQAPVYDATPYFWSDQHGAKIQFVGETEPGDEIVMLEGGLPDSRFAAAYGRDGRLVAALGMRRPVRIMALQRLIHQGAAFPPEL